MTTTSRRLILSVALGLSAHAALAGSAAGPSADELKARILQRLAPEMEERPGFCFRFSYSFEGCTFITRQTYCKAPPPRTADDWSESVSWVPLQIIDPDRVNIGQNGVYLFAAGDRKVLEVRERWLGAVAAGRPSERTSAGEFHYYFPRRRDEREVLAQEFRELVRLCGGTPAEIVESQR